MPLLNEWFPTCLPEVCTGPYASGMKAYLVTVSFAIWTFKG